MTADEPSIFDDLNSYMKARLMIASAIIFRRSNWKDWTYGHEKLLGVIIWHYEYKREKTFKYSKVLRRYAYGRAQNYKLLRGILERNILINEGNGYYTFGREYQEVFDKILDILKAIDKLGTPKEDEEKSRDSA
jgi:hypothetical protein